MTFGTCLPVPGVLYLLSEAYTLDPKQLFRWTGLIACAMATLPVIVDQWFTLAAKLHASSSSAGPQTQAIPLAHWVLDLALAVGFG